MANAPSSAAFSLPKGGGAMHGLGEKFSPDLHTGTGTFTVPIVLPPGRNGFQPQLNLVYSTGNGNGPFGFGWNLGLPGVSRKTSKGVPRYDDAKDVFLLSAVEDLVWLKQVGAVNYYRPRTEGLFAEILYHHDQNSSYWEVRSKDGLVSFYGTAASFRTDPATIADPSDRSKIFAWKLTRTVDPFGNRIEYEYERDSGEEGPHHWDQLYLKQIRYADYDDNGTLKFLVSLNFQYEYRLALDPFSEYRSSFEIRTRKRCSRITVRTHADQDQVVRMYDFVYLDQHQETKSGLPINGISLLSQLKVTGHDGVQTESLPPLEFRYTAFEPGKRNFFPLQGADLPARSLTSPDLELVDLFGNGLPDLVEMNGTTRYWRNLGNGRFDMPRFMLEAPAGLAFSDAGVQLIDANGDGRTDLLVTTAGISGYFPLGFGGQWDKKSFQRYHQAPSFNLEDPEVRLVDLNGDGITDAIRSGSRLECFFNDPKEGWKDTRWVERKSLELFPNISFSDPRVKWADMTGDGLQDIALVYDGNIEYWPNLGYGNWGKRIHMERSPRLPYGYDPRRLLVGDVDGDGLADFVYIEDTKVTLWINQSGNRWSEPITISGTPPVSDTDAVRLVDILGSGISGILWSRETNGLSRDHLFFLDFTGGLKPYLLREMDNHIGAVTKVNYSSSTQFYLDDQRRAETRWKTSLPFPVHVVSSVEVSDYFSKGKLATEYHYHQGHWDGGEREFRGFGMVEHIDTESFEKYNSNGLDGTDAFFSKVDRQYFSPPTRSKTWFHQGPVGDEYGEWQELDWSDQYWKGDPQILKHTETVNHFLSSWPPTSDGHRVKRDALRTLRGSILRSELYGLDGSDRENRPYTVSESCYGLAEIAPPQAGDTRCRIFYPHAISQRTTQWERGDDPMTQFSYTRYSTDADTLFDPFGRPREQTQVACPRGWRNIDDRPAEPFLATRSCMVYAKPINSANYIHDRVAKTTSFEISNSPGKSVLEIAAAKDASADLKLIGQTLSYYDGDAFDGLPLGQIDKFGAVTRTETLVLTDDILQKAYGAAIPPYFEVNGNPVWAAEYPDEFKSLVPRRAGYVFHAGSADPTDPRGFFVNGSRQRYDFQTHPTGRGLVLETLDPLHDKAANPTAHRTLIAHDKYQFLPEQVTNAAGLVMRAAYDYRVLQPAEVIDPNGNQSVFTFTPLGLLKSIFIRGKTQTEGDQNRPSVRMEYGFLAFEESPVESRHPIFVRSIRHVHHDAELDVAPTERDETITSVEYSDGFGRLLQTRTQGEDVRFGNEHFGGGETVVPVNQGDGAGGDIVGRTNADSQNPNVVVSGWQIFDNKGQVVEKYEPFFSDGWEYGRPDDNKTGQKVTKFYDPRGHAIRTVGPDGSLQTVIFGVPGGIATPDLTRPDSVEPTPWEAYTYDANDNAGRTHPAEAASYQHCWNTPASILIDPLGRTIKAVERNREPLATPGSPAEEVVTRSTYDIRGNLLTINDALGRDAFFDHVYDYANHNLRMHSIDAGLRLSVLDARGAPVEQRDSKGSLTLHGYDGLNRPVRLWARDGHGQKVTLREKLEYGDAGKADQDVAERANNKTANCLGKPIHHFDEAGLLSFDRYDFKGNLLEKTRRVVSDAAISAVFNPPPAEWKIEAFRVDWSSPPSTQLGAQAYTTTISFDALNRAKRMIYPEDVDGQRRALIPRYNRAGALESVALDGMAAGGGAAGEVFVERIVYDAKGQRVLICYGNGVMTRYAYDPKTFRLRRLRTDGFIKPAALTYRRTGQLHQEFAYEYDLTGSILALFDRTPGGGINGSAAGIDLLVRTFSFDALYRLRSATGRECDNPAAGFWDAAPRSTDLTKTRSYSEHYQYDLAGNIDELKHLANGAGFTRVFDSSAGNNRLRQMTIGAFTADYHYDANGNMTMEATSRHFEWDYADKMRVYRTQTAVSEPSVHAHYLHDAGGLRVKKLVRKQGGQVEITVYIDGIFEHQRIVRAGSVEQNNTLHLMVGQSRIAMARIGNPFADDPTPSVKYHLEDHLGSSNSVLDRTGNLVSREEYTPYGETSFGSYARKRYRFTGKERDEESGLNYHGARYYAPWSGRWISCDPLGAKGGSNLYQYGAANPVMMVDHTGLQQQQSDKLDGGAPAPAVTAAKVHLESQEGAKESGARLKPGGAADPGPASNGFAEYDTNKHQDAFDARESKKGLKAGAINFAASLAEGGGIIPNPVSKAIRSLAPETDTELSKNVASATEVGLNLVFFAAGEAQAAATEMRSVALLRREMTAALKVDPSAMKGTADQIRTSLLGVEGGGVPKNVMVGVSSGIVDGQQLTVATVSHPKAHLLLEKGAVPLPENVQLGPKPFLFPRGTTIAGESVSGKLAHHVEIMGVGYLEERGAKGGFTVTSGYACHECAWQWYSAKFPTWLHLNVNQSYDYGTYGAVR